MLAVEREADDAIIVTVLPITHNAQRPNQPYSLRYPAIGGD
jgi:hypothetical protein